MKNHFLIAVACLVIMSVSFTAHAVTIYSNYQGWIDYLGSGNGAQNGNNTFTGITGNKYYNSWANFDLSGLSGTFNTVKLELTTTLYNTTQSFTLGIYDVTTSLSSLSASRGGYKITSQTGWELV